MPVESYPRSVQLRVKRYQPDTRDKAYWQEFQVQAEGNDRLGDVLNKIKGGQDGTLTFRRSCVHGVWGSDAMRVNGRKRLACQLLVQDLGGRISVGPRLGFPGV